MKTNRFFKTNKVLRNDIFLPDLSTVVPYRLMQGWRNKGWYDKKRLKAKAERGNTSAQYVLSLYYCYKDLHLRIRANEELKTSGELNRENAIYWCRKAAQQGHALSQILLATIGTEFERWCIKAAHNGNFNAQRKLGYHFKNARYPLNICSPSSSHIDKPALYYTYKQAIYWWTKAAKQISYINAYGSAELQYALGRMYYLGQGTAKNTKTAIYWWKKAAKLGHVQACVLIALVLKNGWGITRNTFEAFKWWKKGAERGDTRAQYNLARAYLDGEGVPKNYEKAAQVLEKLVDTNPLSFVIQSEIIYTYVDKYCER